MKDVSQAEIKKCFQQTIRVNDEERYEVSLLWKHDHLLLADNKVAKRRLELMTEKLHKQDLYYNSRNTRRVVIRGNYRKGFQKTK